LNEIAACCDELEKHDGLCSERPVIIVINLVTITSTKIRKERYLFNVVQRLNAFVKNAVAFLKLF